MALINRDNITYDSEKGLRGLSEQLEDIKRLIVTCLNLIIATTIIQTVPMAQIMVVVTLVTMSAMAKVTKVERSDANALGEEYYERLFGKNKQ